MNDSQPRPTPVLLTPRQVAERLGVAVQTLAKWRCLRATGIPFRRVGRSVRYLERDVSAYINALPVRRNTSDTPDAE